MIFIFNIKIKVYLINIDAKINYNECKNFLKWCKNLIYECKNKFKKSVYAYYMSVKMQKF